MGSKIDVIQSNVIQVLLYAVEGWGDTISLGVLNEIEKIKKLFIC